MVIAAVANAVTAAVTNAVTAAVANAVTVAVASAVCPTFYFSLRTLGGDISYKKVVIYFFYLYMSYKCSTQNFSCANMVQL